MRRAETGAQMLKPDPSGGWLHGLGLPSLSLVLLTGYFGCGMGTLANRGVVASTSPNEPTQHISYYDLWNTQEDIERGWPKSVVVETDFWECAFDSWGTTTTFLKWDPTNYRYSTYTRRTNEYLSGDSGAEHSLSRWYPLDVDADGEGEVVFFCMVVSAGNTPLDATWRYEDGKTSLLYVDCIHTDHSFQLREKAASDRQSLQALPSLMKMESQPVVQAWMQYALGMAYRGAGQGDEATMCFKAVGQQLRSFVLAAT